MSGFKPFAELVVREPVVCGPFHVQTKGGEVIASVTQEEDAVRIVSCWNACRKIFAPAAHIEAIEDRIERVEHLRKEAWATAQALQAELDQLRASQTRAVA